MSVVARLETMMMTMRKQMMTSQGAAGTIAKDSGTW